jgi:hypothetical protein
MIRSASSSRPTRWSVGYAEAEDQAAAADRVGRRRHLREQGRVAERDAHDELPQLDAARCGGKGGEDGPPLMDALDRPAWRA